MRAAFFIVFFCIANVTAGAEVSSFIGLVDLRPSWNAGAGRLYGENFAEAGYRLTPFTSLSYQQQFYFDSPAWRPQWTERANLFDGFVRAKFNDVWKSREYRVSTGYEARAYLPLDSVKRDRGLVTFVRNYFKLSSGLTRDLTLHLMEVPIAHVYSVPGTGNVANPMFENRVYAAAEATFANKRLSFFFPFIFSQTRFSDFDADPVNGGNWFHMVWIYPELILRVSSNVAVGLAYESGNLVLPDYSGVDFINGFKNGVTQLVFQLSL